MVIFHLKTAWASKLDKYHLLCKQLLINWVVMEARKLTLMATENKIRKAQWATRLANHYLCLLWTQETKHTTKMVEETSNGGKRADSSCKNGYPKVGNRTLLVPLCRHQRHSSSSWPLSKLRQWLRDIHLRRTNSYSNKWGWTWTAPKYRLPNSSKLNSSRFNWASRILSQQWIKIKKNTEKDLSHETKMANR